jgi:hypothetical protein
MTFKAISENCTPRQSSMEKPPSILDFSLPASTAPSARARTNLPDQTPSGRHLDGMIRVFLKERMGSPPAFLQPLSERVLFDDPIQHLSLH